MQVISKRLTPIPFVASSKIGEAIAALGRTEDISFSPDGRHLAIAAFYRHRVGVFKSHVTRGEQGPMIELTHFVEVESPVFKRPHGVDFVDSKRMVVSSRSGGIDVFRVPEWNEEVCTVDEQPLLSFVSDSGGLLNVPGSVRKGRSTADQIEILVCNNLSNTLTRHHLDTRAELRWTKHQVFLSKWLNLPDGLAMSQDGRWLAVSSHEARVVLMYDLSQGVEASSDPVGILRQVFSPHGLTFSADGTRLIVADADTPNLLVYAADALGWRGVRYPTHSLRVVDEETYQRGHYAPGEGGVKGVSFCGTTGILATTCHHQPMAFFDLEPILSAEASDSARFESAQDAEQLRARQDDEVRYELLLMAQVVEAHQFTQGIIESASWRITKPLRAMKAAMTQVMGR